jgi:hypothetical protein
MFESDLGESGICRAVRSLDNLGVDAMGEKEGINERKMGERSDSSRLTLHHFRGS